MHFLLFFCFLNSISKLSDGKPYHSRVGKKCQITSMVFSIEPLALNMTAK